MLDCGVLVRIEGEKANCEERRLPVLDTHNLHGTKSVLFLTANFRRAMNVIYFFLLGDSLAPAHKNQTPGYHSKERIQQSSFCFLKILQYVILRISVRRISTFCMRTAGRAVDQVDIDGGIAMVWKFLSGVHQISQQQIKIFLRNINE
jgi:hypothetical protein